MARFSALDGVDETLRKLSTLTVALRDELRGVVRKATERTLSATKSAAPVRTGAMRDAIKAIYFDGGDTGAVFVGPSNDTRGRTRAKNLPIWLEYGTRKASDRPFLVPAAKAAAAAMEADALRIVTASTRAAE